ncbi:MAG: signal peptidase I [Tepidisphaera sp.]
MPAWLFVLVLVLSAILGNFFVPSVILWGIGRLLRTSALSIRRILAFASLLFVVELSLYVTLFLSGVELIEPESIGLALGMVIFGTLTRIAVIKLSLRCGILRACLVAPAVIVLQLGIVLVAGIPFRMNLIDLYQIPTESMSPTIPAKGRVMADRTLSPQRWDLVVHESITEPGLFYVKRVIGLPGELIEILPDGPRVDGKRIELPPELQNQQWHLTPENSGAPPTLVLNSPVQLTEGEFYTVGDNLLRSFDSRYQSALASPTANPGAIPANKVVAVVRLVYRPISSVRFFR